MTHAKHLKIITALLALHQTCTFNTKKNKSYHTTTASGYHTTTVNFNWCKGQGQGQGAECQKSSLVKDGYLLHTHAWLSQCGTAIACAQI